MACCSAYCGLAIRRSTSFSYALGDPPFRKAAASSGVGRTPGTSSGLPVMREFLSGTWQRKQVPDMMGRMSRLKRTALTWTWATPGAAPAAIAATAMLIRTNVFPAGIWHTCDVVYTTGEG